MREEFLHYLWRHSKYNKKELTTTDGVELFVKSIGIHNHDSGPDFFNAQVRIGDQLWAGNVEIHVKSSDWYVHNHENDQAYDNVILHVVWENDTVIHRNNGEIIPTLELSHFVDAKLLKNYEELFSKSPQWINCQSQFYKVDNFTIYNWLERLYFERLEQKSVLIDDFLLQSKNDWEAVLFWMLAKNFGLKLNGEAFLSVAKSFDFSVLRKICHSREQLEALLFGQSKLLKEDCNEAYSLSLREQYKYLKHKFKLNDKLVFPIKFFRLRPPNFPTIRLSQLAQLYFTHHNLFSIVMETNDLEEYYEIFRVSALEYWNDHYTFGTTSKSRKKTLTKTFVDLLLINTIIPIKFAYSRYKGGGCNEEILNIIQKITSEKNSIVDGFEALKPISKTAMDSQALIQLKTQYCDKLKCLHCAVGNAILSK